MYKTNKPITVLFVSSVYPFSTESSSGPLGVYILVTKTVCVQVLTVACMYLVYTVWKRKTEALTDYTFLLDALTAGIGVNAVMFYR